MMIRLIQKFLDYLYSFFLTPSKKQITKFPSTPKKEIQNMGVIFYQLQKLKKREKK